MAAVKDQSLQPSADSSTVSTKRTQRCCALLWCLGTLVTIIVLVVIILIFTVFKVRNPIMTINKIKLGSGNVGSMLLAPGSNITMVVDTSVKNPNVGAFTFSNTTSSISYGGVVVGQAYGPPGRVPARKTLGMNITVELVTSKVLGVPNLASDLGSGLFTMDSSTVAPGKAKLLFVKKRMVVEMNCSVTFNITSQEIKEQHCKSHVDF